MKDYALVGASIVTPYLMLEKGVLIISEGKIQQVGREENIHIPEGMEIVDVSGLTLVPGFIDLHIHGAMGVRASGGVEAIRKMCSYLPSTGTTGWLPTVMKLEEMGPVISAIKEEMEGARILGIHMEGPFLAPKNIPGTPFEEPHLPNLKEYEEMLKIGEGHFRLMGLAPELEGAVELIREMRRTGVVAAVAHSKATYEEFMRAVDAGLSHVTHTYNVMTGLHHRKPGVVGGALVCDGLTAELIGDGYHVSPAAMDILVRCKGIERVALITDNTSYAGLPDGIYDNVEKKNGMVRRLGFTEETDGTLAGSVWPFDHNFRTVKKAIGKNIREMAVMASTVPARVAGVIDRKGTLEPGKDADITILNPAGKVAMCIIGGKIMYRGAM
jgi:N-acetylglucosamine-6-phosphate deacetylase